MLKIPRTATRRIIAAIAGIALIAPTAGPAFAWKPKTHVYLAQLALRDAVDDGRVTIYQTEYETGRTLGPLGDFEVNPAILEALKAKPQQYYAGVVGPDAYPDMMTGQQLIHPGASRHVLGDPSHNEPASGDGVDAWLTYLWRHAYGHVDPTQQRLREAQSNPFLFRQSTVTNTPAIRSFVAGYLTHAAGDMFMHTFVNHYTGGDFAFYPDKLNAVKHLVLEGYVGERTPEPRERTSIEGVQDFIYQRMVRADPGSVLEQRLFDGMAQATSVPAIFSALRNGLQASVDDYYRERNRRSGPSRAVYMTTHGAQATFREHWIADIDRGLYAWVELSHLLSGDLVYNPHGGTNVIHARDIATEYGFEHMLKMAGTPDVAAEVAEFVLLDLRKLVPKLGLLTWLKELLLDAIVMSATGMTFDEFVDYTTSPSTHFDKYMNAPGGGYDGRSETLISLEEFNRTVLEIDDPGVQNRSLMFDPDRFAPAFNTLQMTKMLFLSEKGMRDLLAALEAKGVAVPAMPTAPGAYENAMLGFLKSLDGDNRWQGTDKNGAANGRAFFLAGGADAWRNLFKKQIGERPGWLGQSPSNTAGTPRDDAGFEPIEQWAGRVEGADYQRESGDRVTVTMSFRNDTSAPKTFREVLGPVRPVLKLEGGESLPIARMEFVHLDQATAPQWHYARGNPVPPQGRVTVRLIFTVGNVDRQSRVNGITVFEQRPRSALTPAILVDGPSRDFAVPSFSGAPSTAGKTAAAALSGAPSRAGPRAAAAGGAQVVPQGARLTSLLVASMPQGDTLYIRVQLINSSGSPATLADGAVTGELLKADGSRLSPSLARLEQLDRTPLGAGEHRLDPDRRLGLLLGFGVGRTDPAEFLSVDVIERQSAAPGATELGRTNLPLPGAAQAPQSPPAPSPPAMAALSAAAGPAFVESGPLQLRLDGAGRLTVHGRPAVEVRLTARNGKEQRMGLQYLALTPLLVTSDGVEHLWDGNYYGASGAEMLNATVWLEQSMEAPLTFVFPNVAGDATPVRLVLRDRGAEVASFALNAP